MHIQIYTVAYVHAYICACVWSYIHCIQLQVVPTFPCSGLYPQLAVADENNSWKRDSEQVFHTKVCCHCNITNGMATVDQWKDDWCTYIGICSTYTFVWHRYSIIYIVGRLRTTTIVVDRLVYDVKLCKCTYMVWPVTDLYILVQRVCMLKPTCKLCTYVHAIGRWPTHLVTSEWVWSGVYLYHEKIIWSHVKQHTPCSLPPPP